MSGDNFKIFSLIYVSVSVLFLLLISSPFCKSFTLVPSLIISYSIPSIENFKFNLYVFPVYLFETLVKPVVVFPYKEKYKDSNIEDLPLPLDEVLSS